MKLRFTPNWKIKRVRDGSFLFYLKSDILHIYIENKEE